MDLDTREKITIGAANLSFEGESVTATKSLRANHHYLAIAKAANTHGESISHVEPISETSM